MPSHYTGYDYVRVKVVRGAVGVGDTITRFLGKG